MPCLPREIKLRNAGNRQKPGKQVDIEAITGKGSKHVFPCLNIYLWIFVAGHILWSPSMHSWPWEDMPKPPTITMKYYLHRWLWWLKNDKPIDTLFLSISIQYKMPLTIGLACGARWPSNEWFDPSRLDMKPGIIHHYFLHNHFLAILKILIVPNSSRLWWAESVKSQCSRFYHASVPGLRQPLKRFSDCEIYLFLDSDFFRNSIISGIATALRWERSFHSH